ncbi:MAG: hypothetical protein HC790_01710 [Acaryochloridaceae cyanobacterium CSU_3_4]|nr:hypothetical protein [Acaryochloridaceae cyanobacterium CSU_3_4]
MDLCEPMRDRYLELIAQIVTDTLKGNIRSKEQIYHTLSEKIDAGTGELFERCLQTYAEDLQTQLTSDIDELQQAKATRKQRALTTIQGAMGTVAKAKPGQYLTS